MAWGVDSESCAQLRRRADQNGFSPILNRGNHQQGASMSLNDAERDALEQLQEAIENGDVSLLRKLLNQTDLWFGDVSFT